VSPSARRLFSLGSGCGELTLALAAYRYSSRRGRDGVQDSPGRLRTLVFRRCVCAVSVPASPMSWAASQSIEAMTERPTRVFGKRFVWPVTPGEWDAFVVGLFPAAWYSGSGVCQNSLRSRRYTRFRSLSTRHMHHKEPARLFFFLSCRRPVQLCPW
jgi:hypothetical protein